MTKRTPKTLLMLSALAILAAGVAAPTSASAQVVVDYSADYTPLYYDGYVVFFDDMGRPFIYVDGVPVFIKTSYVNYNTYVGHYRIHRARYRTWYRSHGVRYRTYRSPVVAHRRHVVTHRSPDRRHVVTHRSPARRHVVTHRSHDRRPVVTHRSPTRRHVVIHRSPERRSSVTSHRSSVQSHRGRPAGTSSSRGNGR